MCLICCDEKSISPSPLCHSHSDLFVFLGREGASLVAQGVNNLPAMQETWVQSLSLEDSPGGGNGYPLQYSCLENPMDRGDCWATVYGVAKRWSNSTEQLTLSRSGREDQLFFKFLIEAFVLSKFSKKIELGDVCCGSVVKISCF